MNNLSRIKVYDKVLEPGIQARLWKCPHCNKRYLVTVMDKTARRMMKANKDDRRKIGNISRVARSQREMNKLNVTKVRSNIERVEKLEKTIEDRTKKLDERMQGLIEKYKELA